MKIFLKIILAVCIVCLTIHTAHAIEVDTIIRVDQEHHSISAPDAFIHQWYMNGEKIEGATKRDLEIKETGTYKVEITNTRGEKTEIESSFLVTAAGAIIKIYIIGDSTVCNYNASAYPQAGWGQVLPAFFNTTNLTFSNYAIGGRSSRSFFEEGRWTPIKDALLPGDYVFIQWGHNDRDFSNAGRYTSVADYKNYLIMYCNETKAKGAIPVLISPMVLNAWTGTTMRNVFTETGNNYRGAMLEVANQLNVAFVDLNMKSWNLYKTYGSVYNQHFIYKGFDPGEYPNYPAGINDGTHFQEMGAICNARMIVQGIGELSARADMANLISNIKPQYSIAVSVNPVGRDSMTTKSYNYPSGLTVTLKTIPKKSSTFQKWNNAANTQISTARYTTVTSGSAATSYSAIYAGATTCSATISSTSTAICASGSLTLTANTGASYKWFRGTTQVGTASTYAATVAGSYTVEVTNAAGCKATSAVKTITVNPLPVVTQYVQIGTGAWTAAATASVCEGNVVNLGPQPNVATGWTWTGPNSFTSTLRNPALTNVVVANAGNYVATYTDANGCKATSTFALQVTKPTASITTPTTTIIPYKGSITLNATTGTGYTYQWKRNSTDISGATSASYAAATAGSYTVTVTASTCSATSAAVVLTVSPAPLKYIYNYDNSGNLSWTNTNNWTPKALPTAIDTVIIRTGEVQIANLNHTAPVYVETNGILRLIDTSTVANLRLQGGTLKAYTSAPGMMLTSNITVEQASTIMAGSVAATIFTINGTITGNANLSKTSVGILRINSTATGFKGNWIITDGKLQLRSASGLGVCGVQVKSPGRLDIEVAGASIYSLVVETGAGVDLDQPLATSVAVFGTTNILTGAYQNAAYPTFIGSTSTLNVSNSLVTLSGPTTFCQGSSVTLTSSSGVSYIWKNNTTQVGTAAAYTTNSSGSYTVDATSAAGCKVTSAPVATVGSTSTPPTITATTTSFCPGGSAILTASAGTSYKWFNGTNQVGTASSYTATAAGAYTVEVTNDVGCKATSAATQIAVSATPTASITTTATSFCPGGSIILTASAGASYIWFNGTTQVGTTSTYTASTAGAYTVEVTIAAGCKATSAVTTITESAAPTATITTGSSTTFCSGSSVVLTSSAGTSYKWFNGTTQVGTASSYTANTSGAYTVEVTNASGCKATSAATTITVNALPIASITTPATSFCTGTSLTLTSSAGTSYKWFNGITQVGTAFTHAASTAGSYTVEVTNSDGCKATSASVTITENTTAVATPTITASSTSFCSGGSVILSSSAGTSYKWFNGTTQVGSSSAYTASAAGSYTVEVSNASGCKATSAAIQITIGSTVTWYADGDNDGLGDATSTINACTKPNGYVATAGDACPADVNKATPGNCGCGNTEASCLDCAGTPLGTAFLDNCSICVGGTTGNTACVTTGTVNTASSTGVLSTYPQPFTNALTISLKNKTIKTVTFFNSQGLIIEYRQGINASEIEMGESLSSGIYFIVIESETEVYTSKVIKY